MNEYHWALLQKSHAYRDACWHGTLIPEGKIDNKPENKLIATQFNNTSGTIVYRSYSYSASIISKCYLQMNYLNNLRKCLLLIWH